MACDFRLTNPVTMKREPDFAYKLIRASRPRFSALVGFTGIAFLHGKPTGVWISEQIDKLDARARLEDLLDALAQAGSMLPRAGGATDRRLTFMIGAMVGTQSQVSLVSNFEELVNGRVVRDAAARDVMTISGFKPKGEQYLATGAANMVKTKDYQQLLLSLRSGAEDERIFEQLKNLNVDISARARAAGQDTISPGCYVGSLHATGKGATRPFLTDEEQGDFIPPESEAVFKKLLESHFSRKIDAFGRPMPIRMVQSASATGGGSIESLNEQLKLRPNDPEVWNNKGSAHVSQRQWDEAIGAFEKAIALNPSYATALANLAKVAWLHEKNFTEADRLYTEAVTAAGQSVESWILSDFATFCHEALGDDSRAADLHSRAAQDENYPLAAARQAYFILDSQHDLDRADALIMHAMGKAPNDANILCFAGLIDLRGHTNIDAACEKFHKACSLDPRNTLALRLAADTSLQLADSASAAYYYRKLIKRIGYDVEVDGNYGLALLLERKLEGALKHLSKAARSAPDNLSIRVNYVAALWANRRNSDAVAVVQTLTQPDSPPRIELEANALYYVADPRSRDKTAVRMKQLITEGIQADGLAVRAMVSTRPHKDREAAAEIAKIIEGKAATPADW
jgi:tetratricopeptide (TPR) repeat protein